MKDDLLYLRHILEAIDRIRDRVVHDYFGVSLDIVWDVVQNHLPPLREKILRALPEG